MYRSEFAVCLDIQLEAGQPHGGDVALDWIECDAPFQHSVSFEKNTIHFEIKSTGSYLEKEAKDIQST